MALILVRQLDDAAVRRLKIRAREKNTSVETLAREAIHKAAELSAEEKRAGEIVLDEVAAQVGEIPLLVTTVDGTGMLPRALEIAAGLGHPVYGCVYLTLAEARGDELMNADLRLLSKVAGSDWSERVKELGG